MAGKQAAGSAMERFKADYWDRYAPLIDECEERLIRLSNRPGLTLGESCSFTLSAGGKRLRPLLVFLSAKKGFVPGERHFAAALAVELVHMATLVHDDVLDGARLRRGRPTLLAKYGLPVSIAAGDYLFAGAFEVLSQAGSPQAISLLARSSLGLSHGELLQMSGAGNLDLSFEEYVKRCSLKTSGLFSAACQLGALFSGCSDAALAALGEFGHCLGLAFQIADDILDFSGDSGQTGKQVGTDLRDGTVTLPLVFALKRDALLKKLLQEELSDELVAEICRRVGDCGGLDDARSKALEYVDRASEALTLAASELEVEPLELIAQSVVDRRY